MERFVLNETSYFGYGSREVLPQIIKQRNYKKVLLVTDESLIKCNVVQKVSEILAKANIKFRLFADIKPNPTVENVKEGLVQLKKVHADVIVAVGGGSVIDTAKAMAVIATNPQYKDVISLDGVANTKNKCLPIIALPTTAGTAAEVTINYVITDTKRHKKMVCVDPNDIPTVAIVDAELMESMPKNITASTGMDALTHAIECMITKSANSMSDMFAYQAIKDIYKYLPIAVKDGKNREAREKMAQAQYIAGMGFSNVGLGIVHSMAHPLGGRFDIAHGLANAMLLPTVMKYNLDSPSKPKFRLIAEAMGIDTKDLTDEQAGQKAIKAVEKLKKEIGIPEKLSSLGILESDLDVLSEDAMNDVCTPGNPRETSVEDIKKLYKSIL